MRVIVLVILDNEHRPSDRLQLTRRGAWIESAEQGVRLDQRDQLASAEDLQTCQCTTLWRLTDLIFPPDSRWAFREVVAPSKLVVVPIYFRMMGVDGVRGSCHGGFVEPDDVVLPPLFLINGWAEQHVAPVVAWRWISEDSSILTLAV